MILKKKKRKRAPILHFSPISFHCLFVVKKKGFLLMMLPPFTLFLYSYPTSLFILCVLISKCRKDPRPHKQITNKINTSNMQVDSCEQQFSSSLFPPPSSLYSQKENKAPNCEKSGL